jgi:Family of unknown function (DUF6029)
LTVQIVTFLTFPMIRISTYFPIGFCLLLFLQALVLQAQDAEKPSGGQLNGSLQANANFFIRDSLIGAANIPQYDRQKYGADLWLNLNYSNWGFDFGFRFDVFNNSNLLNPTDSYTDQGIGMWFVKKQVDKLGIHAGFIYDQIGSGIIFRAFEERPLLIDNALVGLKVDYALGPNWKVKAFTGRQKQQFTLYRSIIKGLSVDGFVGKENSNWSIAPGFGIVNRTIDDQSMNNLVASLNTYQEQYVFVPKYNAYAFSAYNTLTNGNWTWYLEGAYKTADTQNDPFAVTEINGEEIIGDRFISKPGSVLYSNLSYAANKFGLSVEGKRTQNFSFRTRPQEQINRGTINFLPPMARSNTYRLTSRYNAATQELGEWAFQADAKIAPSKKLSFNLNFSNITKLDQTLLYREIYAEMQLKIQKKWIILSGVQRQEYNQEVYEFKPNVPLVQTITPFVDVLYKFNPRKALRFEAQYMNMVNDKAVNLGADYGSWAFALLEMTMAPNWTFTLSDMYNAAPGRESPIEKGERKALHYPRVDVFYTVNANRFSLSYVKQVEGVVCTGGICRLEPAFSGFKMTLSSTF